MPATARLAGVSGARLLLATALLVSGGLLAAVGGRWGLALGAGQVLAAAALLVRPLAAGPLAGTVVVLVAPPLAAVRHWTARLPGACRCARLAHPPPGLVSLTGLVVSLDLVLLGLTMRLTATHRKEKMGKSQP